MHNEQLILLFRKCGAKETEGKKMRTDNTRVDMTKNNALLRNINTSTLKLLLQVYFM